MYTSNAFSLSTWDDEHATVDYMSYYFLPHRLTQIRQLRFDWELDTFSYNHHLRAIRFEAWNHSWSALWSLTGLRKLHISLSFRWRAVLDCYEECWKDDELELLDPVRSITAPVDFVLVLPDQRCLTDVDMGDSNCVLRHPRSPHPPSELP